MLKGKVEQVQEIHRKNWGKELWIVNKKEYCGKILYFHKGYSCSVHYHNEKDEVFYLLKGKVEIYYSDNDFTFSEFRDFPRRQDIFMITLLPGETFHVYPGLRHKISASEDSELLEISTEHKEEDSIRIEKGD